MTKTIRAIRDFLSRKWLYAKPGSLSEWVWSRLSRLAHKVECALVKVGG